MNHQFSHIIHKTNPTYPLYVNARAGGMSQAVRFRVKYDKARDYLLFVLERFVSRFGYSPSKARATRKLHQIIHRWKWHMHYRTKLQMPDIYYKVVRMAIRTEYWGPYCPIGPVGYETDQGMIHLQLCRCGNPFIPYRHYQFPQQPDRIKSNECWPVEALQGAVRCSDPNCTAVNRHEIESVITDTHPSLLQAKRANIKYRKPKGGYESVPAKDRAALALANLILTEVTLNSRVRA